MQTKFALLLVLLLMAFGCGGGSSSTTDPGGGDGDGDGGGTTANIAGTYAGIIRGTWEGEAFEVGVVVTFAQNGTNVTFTWYTSEYESGSGTAKVSGSQLTNLVMNQTEPCEGHFSGSAEIQNDGNRISGSYAGNDCTGHTDAVFVIDRQ